MTDYIDRQATIDKINERQRKLIYCFGFENDAVKIRDIAKSIVSAIPSEQPELESADVAPVVHAYWRDTGSGQECSACKEIQYGYDTGRHYCANCGAKMDGEE